MASVITWKTEVVLPADSSPLDPLASQVFTDISEFVRGDIAVDVRRGRSDETSEVQPSTMTLTVDNSKGVFTPGNALAPTNNAEGGTNGVAVSDDNSGGVSGRKWTSVSSGITFSNLNTSAASPLLSYKIASLIRGAGAGAANKDMYWLLTEDAETDEWAPDPYYFNNFIELRARVTMSALPTGGRCRIMQFYPVAKVWLTTAGKLELEMGASSTYTAGTATTLSITTGSQFEIAMRIGRDGTARLRVWLTPGAAEESYSEQIQLSNQSMNFGNNDAFDWAIARFGFFGPGDTSAAFTSGDGYFDDLSVRDI